MKRTGLSASHYYSLASRLYPPLSHRDTRSNQVLTSTSQRMMLENGLIEYAGGAGLFHILPMGMRAMGKLSGIINEEMNNIGAQMVQMASICERKLLEKTGRVQAFGNDLFQLKDRMGEDYFLAPTHEESITSAASRLVEMSPSSAPLLLYQATSKFRDEMKPRFGLLRGREFLMKDLYSFDLDEHAARSTYEMCLGAYERIFRIRLAPLKKDVFRVLSDVGAMGGSLSHEFHIESDCGEDRIDYCDQCKTGLNRELIKQCKTGMNRELIKRDTDPNKELTKDGDEETPSICSNCQASMKTLRTVEVAHGFLLGTKYSKALGACFSTSEGRQSAYMGSYGIGVTRLLAAIIDCNANQKQQIRWPLPIAPFVLCIIPPKAGSKEDTAGATRFAVDTLETLMNEKDLKGEILYDDRTDLTVGRRLLDAKRMGYPFIVVANKSIVTESIPKLELYDLTVDPEKMELVTHEELFSRMRSLEFQ